MAQGLASQSLRTATMPDGEKYRMVAVPIVNSPGWALVMLQSLDERDRLLSRLGIVTLLFGGLGVLVAGLAGWVVARNGLRPVRNLTTAVEGIARTEDLTPMPIEGDDEIARLGTAFNEMLVALDASRERQRRLVADAGHELRTPLTSLRTNVDLLTQADAADGGPDLDPAARTELLDDIRGQIEELTTLIGDLTELSREAPTTPIVERVELSELLEHAVARVRRRAPSLTFDVAHRAVVAGRRGQQPRARDDQPARQRRQVEPVGRHGHGAAVGRRAHRRRRGAGHQRGGPASTSSSGSGEPRSRAPCPARASACRSWRRWPSGTPAGSTSVRRRPGAPGSRSPSRVRRRRMREGRAAAWVLALALPALVLVAGCSNDDGPPPAAPTPTEAQWNPCDALDAEDVGREFGGAVTKDDGTPTSPVCAFSPTAEGDPVIDANYQLYPAGLAEDLRDAGPLRDRDGHLAEGARRRRREGGRRPDDDQLYVSGFVQNGDLIQTVDAIDPAPFDRDRVVQAVIWALGRLSTHARGAEIS